jgi:hemerythrin-like metal-binding protein
MLISWNDHFTVGIDAVDSGHALVIDTINRLHKAATAEHSAQVVAEMLPRLRRHFSEQFAIEDMVLRDADDALRGHHEREHQRLTAALDVVDDHRASGGNAAGILLLNLVCFLVSHLRGTDGDSYRPQRIPRRAA